MESYMPGSQASWLLSWVDVPGAKSPRDGSKLLKSRQAQRDLRDTMAQVPFSPPVADDSAPAPIAAGAALDLSGSLDCLASSCLKAKVDTLLRRVWHYFDKVYVVGPSAHSLASR